MSEYLDNKALRKLQLGRMCPRAASILPQTVATPGTPYYRIYGGKILLTGLIGEMTVGVGGAVNAHWEHDPTTGATAAISAAKAMAAWVAGDILSIDGLLTNVMTPTAHAGAAVMLSLAGKGIILTIGDLGVVTSASQTGNWSWQLFYVPIDDGAYVRAV